ncbi:TspO/MBR family protein [Rhizobium populisoli]|uniref:TspO/MBR family protein n=1 Tax=Rhizobium populisoli TaxID=2859785 RepID=UPI00248480C4|nr:TspO/MBR family protein [Rhizobium populisoli]
MNEKLALGIFILIVVGMGALIGLMIRPGEWYASLTKPPFNPPNWVFGPAWMILYVLIAIAGWKTWKAEGLSGARMKIWYGQMILNWLWTPVFFGLHAMAFGLVIILGLLVVISYFLVRTRDRVARLCFVPYALWVAFASTLNSSLLLLNN